jgi:hypothetical protein
MRAWAAYFAFHKAALSQTVQLGIGDADHPPETIQRPTEVWTFQARFFRCRFSTHSESSNPDLGPFPNGRFAGLFLGLFLGLILGPHLRSIRSPGQDGPRARPGLPAGLFARLPASPAGYPGGMRPLALPSSSPRLTPRVRPEDEKAARVWPAISGYKLLLTTQPGSNGPMRRPVISRAG